VPAFFDGAALAGQPDPEVTAVFELERQHLADEIFGIPRRHRESMDPERVRWPGMGSSESPSMPWEPR